MSSGTLAGSVLSPESKKEGAVNRVRTAWKYRRLLWKYRKPLWTLYKHQKAVLVGAGAAAGFLGAAVVNRTLARG